MLRAHPAEMTQHIPRSPLQGTRGQGRRLRGPFLASAIDMQAEYQFWHVYERVVRPLPGGGLNRAWLVCQKVYRDRWQHPHDSQAAGLSRVLFGKNMTAERASELMELHALVSRRVAALVRRDRQALQGLSP